MLEEIHSQLQMNSDDPRNPIYYYTLLLSLIIIATILKLSIGMLNKHFGNTHDHLDSTLLTNADYPRILRKNKNSLRIRYLFCYTLTRANIWSKAPYLYSLYNNYHNCSIDEI